MLWTWNMKMYLSIWYAGFLFLGIKIWYARRILDFSMFPQVSACRNNLLLLPLLGSMLRYHSMREPSHHQAETSTKDAIKSKHNWWKKHTCLDQNPSPNIYIWDFANRKIPFEPFDSSCFKLLDFWDVGHLLWGPSTVTLETCGRSFPLPVQSRRDFVLLGEKIINSCMLLVPPSIDKKCPL